jgi:hypothetical protein
LVGNVEFSRFSWTLRSANSWSYFFPVRFAPQRHDFALSPTVLLGNVQFLLYLRPFRSAAFSSYHFTGPFRPATPIEINDLAPAVIYVFQARAFGKLGFSGWSSPFKASELNQNTKGTGACAFCASSAFVPLSFCGRLYPFAVFFKKGVFVHARNAVELGSAAIHSRAENAAFIRRPGNCAVIFRVPLVCTNSVHPALKMFAIPIFYGH